jgi:quinolinate synthase
VLDKEINKIKNMLGAIIVAHNYQLPEVQKVADFVGDSLELARKVVDIDAGYIVLAGVDFMAETAAILNPSKTVLIPSKIATCEMAQYLDVETMRKYNKLHPKAKTVLYVNSTAECKALADIVCTSANAIKVVESINAEEILFGPDANLANYVARNTNKKVIPLPTKGHCYVHTNFDSKRILKLKKMYGGIIMAHPECVEEVQKIADVVTSTGGMVKYVAKSEAKKFIVATECDMSYRLKTLYPDREFIPANDKAICLGMKQITAQSILESLKYKRYEVHVKEKVAEKARRAIERMLELDDDHV